MEGQLPKPTQSDQVGTETTQPNHMQGSGSELDENKNGEWIFLLFCCRVSKNSCMYLAS